MTIHGWFANANIRGSVASSGVTPTGSYGSSSRIHGSWLALTTLGHARTPGCSGKKTPDVASCPGWLPYGNRITSQSMKSTGVSILSAVLEEWLKGLLLCPTLTQSFPSLTHTPICHVRQRPRHKLQAFRFCDGQRRCRIECWSDAAFPAAPAEEQTRGDDQVLFQPVACARFAETGSVPLKYWRCGNHRVIACDEEPSNLIVCSVQASSGLVCS